MAERRRRVEVDLGLARRAVAQHPRAVVRLVPVAREDLRALHGELARLARLHRPRAVVLVDDPDVGVRQRQADRAGAGVRLETDVEPTRDESTRSKRAGLGMPSER